MQMTEEFWKNFKQQYGKKPTAFLVADAHDITNQIAVVLTNPESDSAGRIPNFWLSSLEISGEIRGERMTGRLQSEEFLVQNQ
jgi:hypothetical protein